MLGGLALLNLEGTLENVTVRRSDGERVNLGKPGTARHERLAATYRERCAEETASGARDAWQALLARACGSLIRAGFLPPEMSRRRVCWRPWAWEYRAAILRGDEEGEELVAEGVGPTPEAALAAAVTAAGAPLEG